MTTAPSATAQIANRSFGRADDDAEPPIALHRIDAAHHGEASTSENTDFDPAAIRTAHADDLIGFLQQWSEELDERAAKLHADIATQERRERAFRLWMQNRRTDLDSQIAQYQTAQRQAEAIARRLAVGE